VLLCFVVGIDYIVWLVVSVVLVPGDAISGVQESLYMSGFVSDLLGRGILICRVLWLLVCSFLVGVMLHVIPRHFWVGVLLSRGH